MIPPTPEASTEADLMQAAFAHFNAGRQSQAAALYDEVLIRNPQRLGALLMRGLILSEGPDADPVAAEQLFLRCLAVSPEYPLALNHLGQLRQARGEHLAAVALFERAVAKDSNFGPAFNNLGVSLHAMGRRAAALDSFDRALAANSDLHVAHGNRAQVLADMGRWDEAAAAFRAMLIHAPDSVEAWRGLAFACNHVNALAEAEDACRRAIALNPEDIEIHVQLATALERSGRPQEAEDAFAAAARLRGTVIESCLGGLPQARVLVVYGQGGGNVPAKYLFDRAMFQTISVHLPPPGKGDDMNVVLSGLPDFDIVFSAVGDGDERDPLLRQAAALADLIDVPVLNLPGRIPATARDRLPALLDGIPGLVVPETRRFHRSEAESLTIEGDTPVLIRPAGSHGGHNLAKIHTRSDLEGYLAQTPQNSFFISRYVDFRSDDGYYRKYRFIFVGGEVYPYHLAIHDDWLIHYFRADMVRQPWMKHEEEAFLADYRSIFPGRSAEAVHDVARRLGLDYGGMDCALTRDGRVLVFEANACMLLHLQDSAEEFPYKHRYVPRIFDAVGRMVLDRLRSPTPAADQPY